MTTRFTRVTVVGDGRQIDISLPATAPLAEQMPAVLRLLSVPNGAVPVRWRLAAPEFGPLDPNRSLDEVGVLDGTQLFLSEAAAAPPPPFVDDVESAVAEFVQDTAANFTGEHRRSAVARLLTIPLLAAVLVGLTAPAPIGMLAPVLVILGAVVLGRLVPERGGAWAAAVAVPAASSLLLAVVAARPSAFGLRPTDAAGFFGVQGGADIRTPLGALPQALGWNGFPLAAAAAAAIGLVLFAAARRIPGVGLAGGVVAVASAAAVMALRLGLPVDRTAGLGLVVAVVLSGMAGQTALGGAGLVDLMVADERGEPVPRATVARAVRRGLGTAIGMVWATAAIGATCCWALITVGPTPGTAGWVAPAVGALGGLIFALRSRMFSRSRQVGPMLATALVTLVVVFLTAPGWLSLEGTSAATISLVALAAAGVVVGVAGLRTLREVAGARLARSLERLELLAVLALVPSLVLLFRAIPAVQRWWG